MAFSYHISYSVEEVNDLIEHIQDYALTNFVVMQKERFYGSNEWSPTSNSRVYWEHLAMKNTINIAFDGCPFMFVGRKVLGCHHGKDKCKRQKLKLCHQKQKEQIENHPYALKRRNLVQPSKKKDCPAQIYTLQIAKFLDYKITSNTRRKRREASAKLHKDLEQNARDVKYDMLYFTTEPKLCEHIGHPVPEISAKTGISKRTMEMEELNCRYPAKGKPLMIVCITFDVSNGEMDCHALDTVKL